LKVAMSGTAMKAPGTPHIHHQLNPVEERLAHLPDVWSGDALAGGRVRSRRVDIGFQW
jgi:hypothetical protein